MRRRSLASKLASWSLRCLSPCASWPTRTPVYLGPYGYAAESTPELEAYEDAQNIAARYPQALAWMLANATPASAFYAALLSAQLGNSPFFLNALRPEEVRVLYRDEAGYTGVVRASDIRGIPEFIKAGSLMGHLWLEGHFGVGDPLVNAGAPTRKGRR